MWEKEQAAGNEKTNCEMDGLHKRSHRCESTGAEQG